MQAGKPSEAIPFLQEAINLDAKHFEAHHALGSALLQTGRFADAGAVLLQALMLRSNSAEAWRDIGTAYDRQNLHDPAIEAYRNAVQLAPDSLDVLCRLGELYVMYSRKDEAAKCYERAADIRPDTTRALLLRSDARLLRGDMAGAEQWARKAVALDPQSSGSHGTLAGLLYEEGRFEEAAQSYDAAVRIDPKAGRCWYGLAECRTGPGNEGSVLNRIQDVLQHGDLSDFDRMHMHFALGRMFDTAGDYAQAMEHFEEANTLRSRDLRFDPARIEAMVDDTIKRFTPEFIASASRTGNPDRRPLFVVGMARSGTTLTEQILSSHPEIAAGGELAVWKPGDIEVDPATGLFDPAGTGAAIERYLSTVQRIGPAAARVTDKLTFNVFRLGAIHALLPNATFVHCRRDPIDTCLSIYTSTFRSRISFAARKADLVAFYRQYQRIMDHWRKVLPAHALMEIQYEQLISDRERESRRLIAFSGLAWNDACLRPELNARAVNTASAWQARQPVYATSVQRWRNYEPWLGELRQLLPTGET